MENLSKRAQTAIEVTVLLIVPVALIICAMLQVQESAGITLLVVVGALVMFFFSYEKSRPALHQIMPTVVLAALAVAGRLIFYYVPYVKPVSAICIIAGVMFGKRSAFMVGALAALVSNIFFGQGPWTAWQMYAWGLVGYLAGALSEHGFFGEHITTKNSSTSANGAAAANGTTNKNDAAAIKSATSINNTGDANETTHGHSNTKKLLHARPLLYVYGFLSALLYGFILNSYYVLGFVQPLTLESALLAYGAGLFGDVIHGLSTVVFLLVLYAPWSKKLMRIKEKYANHL